MKNPYRILGINDNATQEEIQKAYRELAKKYHPDNFQDDTMKELAEEKMKEINEAYDFLTRRAGGNSKRSESVYFEIRSLINSEQFSEAEIRLDAIMPSDRGAEWNFLKGCVVSQRGWYLDAQRYFDTACNMDPDNTEYRTAYESMRSSAYDYSRGYDQRHHRSDSDACCDCCTNLICLDCCCECMGGDLIPCC